MDTSMKKLTVLLVEDQLPMIQSVKSALSDDPEFEFLGYLQSRLGVEEFVTAQAPDVALVDLELPVPGATTDDLTREYSLEEGLWIIGTIKEISPQTLVIAFSDHFLRQPALAQKALSAGATAVLPKQAAPRHQIRDWGEWLRYQARSIAFGYWRPDAALLKLVQQSMREDVREGIRLSRREEEVLDLYILGLSDEESAAKLVLSPATIRSHIRNIMSKYRAQSRGEMVDIIRRSGNWHSDDNNTEGT